MRYIPSEKDLAAKVKLVEVQVKGRYIARVNEKSTVSRNYDVKVLVPEGFTLSDIKRATPKVLKDKLDDFVVIRDWYPQDKGKKTDKVIQRKDLYADYELNRFAKLRAQRKKEQKAEEAARNKIAVGGAVDTTEYERDTGLPPVINDDPDE